MGALSYAPHRVEEYNQRDGVLVRSVGQKDYELKDHLGNVRVLVSDRKEWSNGILSAAVRGYYHYYPFGMHMPQLFFPGNTTDNGGYRYGFNGMEKDDEVKGGGNSYTTTWRQYDPRLGRFFSIDPKAHELPSVSPYAFALNNPVQLNDPNGDCPPGVICSDVVTNPQISKGNASANSNRFSRVIRTRKDGTKYYHTGVDILAPVGTVLNTVLAGEVVRITRSTSKEGLGNTIVVKTELPDGSLIYIAYSHLETIAVSQNQKIDVGSQIGTAGITGNAANIPVKDRHVHIEASTDGVFYGGKNRVDPEQFFKTKFDEKGNAISDMTELVKYYEDVLAQWELIDVVRKAIEESDKKNYSSEEYEEYESQQPQSNQASDENDNQKPKNE